MKRLNPSKLHVSYSSEFEQDALILPRRYTLTHSDLTGDLYLTIGKQYNRTQISNWYTRLMRDEVLAEWVVQDKQNCLNVYCHISGGFVFGTTRFRYNIFRKELPLVLEVFRYGDKKLFNRYPELEKSPIWVYFQAKHKRYKLRENWGTLEDYR